MRNKIILVLNIVALILALLWFLKTKEYEPIIALISIICSLGFSSTSTFGTKIEIGDKTVYYMFLFSIITLIVCFLIFSFRHNEIVGIKGDNNNNNQIEINK